MQVNVFIFPNLAQINPLFLPLLALPLIAVRIKKSKLIIITPSPSQHDDLRYYVRQDAICRMGDIMASTHRTDCSRLSSVVIGGSS